MAYPALNLNALAGRPRILVAEDQADVVAALQLLLRRNGYDAEFVGSPAEALEALRTRQFSAALLDMNYSRDTTSGSEGLELVSQVQAIDGTLAVIVMTAWGSIDLAVGAMHRGACDFVQKPWDNAHLLNVLEKQVKRSQELREKRLSEALEQQEAALIQRALMPSEIEASNGLSISASTQSAHTIGGDYFDVIRLDENRSAVCIGDVTGKGVAAALLMSNLQASVRMLSPEITATDVLCDRLNQAISANHVPGKFITFFYCVVDGQQRSMTFTNAGHNWPILAHADGTFERLHSDDTVLGTNPEWTYHQEEVELRRGDRLVLFTDGITEACDAASEEFSEERLLKLVTSNVALPPAALKATVLEAARAHCQGTWNDDATLIVVAVE